MKLRDLQYEFPQELIATSRAPKSRVMWVDSEGEPEEIALDQLIEKFKPGEVLVLNNTRVVPRRVFANHDSFDILFLKALSDRQWEVLFQLRKLKSEIVQLPGGVTATLISKGKPQILQVSEELEDSYFEKFGEMPLPPYIHAARGKQHTLDEDRNWYQNVWAEKAGSVAAPTAGLHFSQKHLDQLRHKQVEILHITLHVGAGTFLPVKTEDLKDHPMHSERVEISAGAWQKITQAREANRRVWALGTTVTRALESAALGLIPVHESGDFLGDTDLLIQDDFDFKIVGGLLTNFHQPASTLLALVCSFAGHEKVMVAYQWAIERKFRLFSYGDLTAWLR